jgi:type I restriction enzyme S subunit
MSEGVHRRLPAHWADAPFDIVFRNVTSSSRKLPMSNYLPTGQYPVIDQGDQFVGGFTNDEALLHPGPVPAIVFGDHTRCVKYVSTPFVQGADGVKVLAPATSLHAKYAYWALKQAEVPSKGYARHFAAVRTLRLPVAPAGEQDRIVSAIESYFTRLDDAVATLERVQRNLKRYRASVLKAAVEGRLVPTEAELARAEGRSYEPASVLLTRILAERGRRWEEAELAKMTAKGKVPKDDRWKARYVEPVAPDTSELPELPEGWCWASVDQLGEVSGGLTQNAKREGLPLQLPFLRVANVYANELRLDDIKHIGVSESEIDRVRLAPRDLLVVEGNGSIEQIGRVALWDGSIDPCLHQNHLIKVRFVPVALAAWSLCWLLAPAGRVAIERAASSSSGLHTLSLSKVQRLPIPLPPLSEQARITSEEDRLITIALAAAIEASTDIQRLVRLRQSILKWAFEGRLVDQDPTDEPAAVLLERIRAERTSATDTPPRRARRAKARAAQS